MLKDNRKKWETEKEDTERGGGEEKHRTRKVTQKEIIKKLKIIRARK